MVQKTKIEWADYVCNPIKGICKMGCPYCYAVRMYKRFKWNPEVRFDYTAFDGLEKLKAGSKIFVGSTHDIFGDWIADDRIIQIILEAGKYPNLVFMFLTKNPKRYNNFMFHKNIWLGYSTTGNLFHKWDYKQDGNIKFVSLEPMQSKIHASLEGFAQRVDFDWLIVGQESGNRKGKHIVNSEELLSTLEFARKAGMKVFVKDNLKNHFDSMIGNPLEILPQEFPEDKRHCLICCEGCDNE